MEKYGKLGSRLIIMRIKGKKEKNAVLLIYVSNIHVVVAIGVVDSVGVRGRGAMAVVAPTVRWVVFGRR